MLRVLTEDADLRCAHMASGRVQLSPHQGWVTVGGRRVLVEGDTAGRPVRGCTMLTPAAPPCLVTITADEAKSFAAFVTLRGRGDSEPRRLCLESATGVTDYAQLRTTVYGVKEPGQSLLRVAPGRGG